MTTTTKKVSRPVGECPWCNRVAALRSDGTLNKHGYTQNRGGHLNKSRSSCEGSGKFPQPTLVTFG